MCVATTEGYEEQVGEAGKLKDEVTESGEHRDRSAPVYADRQTWLSGTATVATYEQFSKGRSIGVSDVINFKLS